MAKTLAEIKRRNIAAGGNFFSRATMKFFGDTMKSFGVKKGGKVLYRKGTGAGSAVEYDILPSGLLTYRRKKKK